MPGEHDREHVEARRVLLDALEAPGRHRKAVVLVGAQAIYQRVGEGELQVAPSTCDGDLALNPSELDDEPLLAEDDGSSTRLSWSRWSMAAAGAAAACTAA